MPTRNIVFVGFQDQPNLGIGYLASTMLMHGFNVELLNFRMDPKAIVDRVRELDPLLIGLSIIYQYYTIEFAELVRELRDQGVTCDLERSNGTRQSDRQPEHFIMMLAQRVRCPLGPRCKPSVYPTV